MPDSIHVDVDSRELAQFVGDLSAAEKGMRDRAADVFEKHGPSIVKSVKAVTPVDTGALRRSVGYRVIRPIPQMTIGTIEESVNPKSGQPAQSYARYVHDGTSRVGGRPYVQKGVDKHLRKRSRFMRDLSKAGVETIISTRTV